MPREAHEYVATQALSVPDKVEILTRVETALSWDVGGPVLPLVEDALDMAQQFTDYGWIVAAGLNTRYSRIPPDSPLGHGVQATLSEAGRRLSLKPLAPSAAPRSAAHRAQNLARLIKAVNLAVGQVGEEQARARPAWCPQRR